MNVASSLDGCILLEIQDSLNDRNRSDYVEDEVPHTPTRTDITYAIPYVGMEFESLEKAKNYYEEYGRQQGFWIRLRDKKRGISRCNGMTMAMWTCSRADKPVSHTKEDVGNMGSAQSLKSRTCSSIMIGCKVLMRVRLERHTLKFKVVDFSDDHNHEVITPNKRMNMRSNRHMPDA